jgi:hypothetical protein
MFTTAASETPLVTKSGRKNKKRNRNVHERLQNHDEQLRDLRAFALKMPYRCENEHEAE